MSTSSLWDRSHMRIKQVPTFQEVLCSCDRDRLVQVLLGDWTSRMSQGEGGAPKSVRKQLNAALGIMRSLSIDAKANRTDILFPRESFVLQGKSLHIVHHIGAELLSKRDFPAVRQARNDDERDSRMGRGEEFTHDYVLHPWEKTLADRVWLAGPWCRRERYAVLASVFWEMTYFGFEYDRVHARIMEEKTRNFIDCRQDGEMASCRGMTVSDVAVARSKAMGLVEPDRFELDYRDRLVQYVARLNRAACLAFYDRVLDFEKRLDKG